MIADLKVAVLLRAKAQPDNSATSKIKLTHPQALLGATNAKDYSLTFQPLVNGASKYAFDSQTFIDGCAAASDESFMKILDDKWAPALSQRRRLGRSGHIHYLDSEWAGNKELIWQTQTFSSKTCGADPQQAVAARRL
jgi:hypothetical protein